MEYPTDFPENFKGPIEAAYAEAEIAFAKARSVGWCADKADYTIGQFVRTVFIAFGRQVCAIRERELYTGERARNALIDFLADLTRAVYIEKHPGGPGSSIHIEVVVKQIRDEIQCTAEWTEIQERLKVAAAPAVAPKRGYRVEIDQWMQRTGIENLDLAARRLGISKSTLKSIRSSRGEKRYSDDTLQSVLDKIKG